MMLLLAGAGSKSSKCSVEGWEKLVQVERRQF